jgi:hypothetical protein
MGREIYCYKNKTDQQHRLMHSLVSTYVKDIPAEHDDKNTYYPVKIMFPPNKSRVLYFTSSQDQ